MRVGRLERQRAISLQCGGRALTVAIHTTGIDVRGRRGNGTILVFAPRSTVTSGGTGAGPLCSPSSPCIALAHVGDGQVVTLQQVSSSPGAWGAACEGAPAPADSCVVRLDDDVTVTVG